MRNTPANQESERDAIRFPPPGGLTQGRSRNLAGARYGGKGGDVM
jgi:hypothetical protein